MALFVIFDTVARVWGFIKARSPAEQALRACITRAGLNLETEVEGFFIFATAQARHRF